MAALSLSASSSGACRAASRSSNKGVVTFGDDDVIEPSSHSLSSTFYQGDECETPVRRNSGGHGHLHVGFSLDDGESPENLNVGANGGAGGSGGKKFLTAKYKKQRMGLVRRRMEVEDWIDSELKKILDVPGDSCDSYEGELDLDELIDLPSDDDRTTYIKKQLSDMATSDNEIDTFIQELLVKIANL